MPDSRQLGSAKHGKGPAIEVYWTTISYRTVAIYVVLVVIILCAGVYLARPAWLVRALDRVSHNLGAAPSNAGALAQNQARFVNLDGKVEIKRVNSVTWENADYRTTLDRGRSDSDRRRRRGTAHLRGRHNLYDQIKFFRDGGTELHRSRSNDQRRRAHQFRRRRFGYGDMAIAAIACRSFFRERPSIIAGK